MKAEHAQFMGDVIASWKRDDQALSDAIYGDGRQSLIAHIIDPAAPKSEMPSGPEPKGTPGMACETSARRGLTNGSHWLSWVVRGDRQMMPIEDWTWREWLTVISVVANLVLVFLTIYAYMLSNP
jgi:hypothetical protein